jgi:hypothetical protein
MTQRWRFNVVAAAAAAAGLAIGAWVDRTSPNPVYGAVIILLGAGVMLVFLGLLVARRGPVGRGFALSAVALLCGMAVGAAILGAPESILSYGSMTLRLDSPHALVASGPAGCEVDGDDVRVSAIFDNVPIGDGEVVAVSVVEGQRAISQDGTLRADRRLLAIEVDDLIGVSPSTGGGDSGELSEGGESRAGQLVTTSESVLVGDITETSGRVAFADLTAASESVAPAPWLLALDLKGTIAWACSASHHAS